MGIDDKFDAKATTTGGKLKETAGRVSGDENLENEGKGDQLKGRAQDAIEDVKDAAGKVADGIKDAFKK